MASARVQLVRCLTYNVRGRTFQQNAPQIITNASDIAYFQENPEFSVTMLEEVKSKSAPKPEVAPRYSLEVLRKKTKSELMKMGQLPPFNVDLDKNMRQAEMVETLWDRIKPDSEDEGDEEVEDEDDEDDEDDGDDDGDDD